MSLRLAARFAKRELRGGLHGFRIFLACLALGVAATAAVGTVRASIEAGLAEEGAALLGGDAELKFTYRFATDAEKTWMAENASDISEVVDFRSMAVVGSGDTVERGLTQVKAVDDFYPLIGTVGLTPDISLEEALQGQGGTPGAVMEQILIDRMALNIGGRFSLGTQEFVLMAALSHEPDGAAGGFTLGPRTIVTIDSLAHSGLLAPGTLYSTKYRLKLPEFTDLAALEAQVKSQFGTSGLRWTDSRDGAPGVAQFVERLGAFLVLVSLSGLAVGGVGVSAAVRAYLAGKTNVVATLRTLGADRSVIFQTYFLQIGVLSIVGIFLGLLLGSGVPLLLAPLIEARLPIPAVFSVYPVPLIEAATYGTLTALIFTLWPLARTEEVRAATLFRDALGGTKLLPSFRYLFVIGLGLAALICLAGWFSGAWMLTLWTAAGIAGALTLLTVSAILIRFMARKGSRTVRHRPVFRWALAAISGAGEGTTSVVLSLGLGLSVLASVGQIDGNMRSAISDQLPDVAPSYFFVDIQKDQMEDFRARLERDGEVSVVESAPMLRGMLTTINGRPANEVSGNHWVTTGDRGITYAAAPAENTRITEGSWWPEDYTGPPQISFAAEEAAEMGLSLGDELTINILGRDITATITSFREVDFSTGGMGFVLTINPTAVAGAPHSFISTVYANPGSEAAILRDISNAFPNITAIRVGDVITRVSEVLKGLAAAISFGAAATLLTGFLVLIGAAAAGENARTFEAAVLKTMGASRRKILASFALRAALLGAGAGAIALAAGIAGGWAVCRFVLETDYTIIWPSALAIISGGIAANLVAGLAFAWRPLAARPARVLRAQE